MPSRSRGRVMTACIVGLATTLLPSVPATSGGPAPVLWEGVVESPGGAPAAGAEVTAFARPPPASLVPGQGLPRIARTTARPDGRFTLRAAPTGALATLAGADPSGWVTVMVTATTATGRTLAVDSVAWHEGRWVTDPAERFGGAAAGTALERPAALVLGDGAAPAASIPVKEPPVPGDCVYRDGRSLGKHYAQIGEMYLQPGWSGFFHYTQTKSTSWSVGASFNKGASYREVGTSTFSQAASTTGDDLKDHTRLRHHLYSIELQFMEYRWTCGVTNPGGDSYEALTIEATGWTGGAHTDRNLGTPAPLCDVEFVIDVDPDREFQREGKSGTVFERSFGLQGWFGASKVVTLESGVVQNWRNESDSRGVLCGESDYPTKITRVNAM